MNLGQDKAYQVETLFRSYNGTDGAGWFSEPFLSVTFLAYDKKTGVGAVATIESNAIISLLQGVPITLDCRTLGENITNIYVTPGNDTTVVSVYWTKYTGFEWQKTES